MNKKNEIPPAKVIHGEVCVMKDDEFGYFGWPTVAQLGDGTLVVGASGLRSGHICPWGKTVLFFSKDQGSSWTAPRILNDTPLDDRDCGILPLGEKGFLASYFSTDHRDRFANTDWKDHLGESCQKVEKVLAELNDTTKKRWGGSWTRWSMDGHAWSDYNRSPVTSPHGPIMLKDGKILYFGKSFPLDSDDIVASSDRKIMAALSDDNGATWEELGSVPLFPGTIAQNYHEPHVTELPSGELLGHIRIQKFGEDSDAIEKLGIVHFGICQTRSKDRGLTWSDPEMICYCGSPPHLLQHSSGALICSFGRREIPYGERAIVSNDDGVSWSNEIVIQINEECADLGYPSTIELPNGELLTVYYQIPPGGGKCGLYWSRWSLPESFDN